MWMKAAAEKKDLEEMRGLGRASDDREMGRQRDGRRVFLLDQ